MNPTDLDDLMDGVREGVPLEVLIRDFDLMHDRKQRRLKGSIAALNRNLKDTMSLLQSQKPGQSETPHDDLLRAAETKLGRRSNTDATKRQPT